MVKGGERGEGALNDAPPPLPIWLNSRSKEERGRIKEVEKGGKKYTQILGKRSHVPVDSLCVHAVLAL